MIRTEAFVFNAFQVNTYLVWDNSGECLVVDPAFYSADEQERFDRIIIDRDLTLTGQINTHCHVDHLLGVEYTRSKYGCAFRAHRLEVRLVENAPLLGEIFGWDVKPLKGIDGFLEENGTVAVGTHLLRSIHVPGHSEGSLAFYSPEGGFVITGDALFRGSIGRSDLPGGDYDTLIDSIRTRLLTLPPETLVLPGHGSPTTIGEETAGNPFLGRV
jgi:hydroxyacylglutathione hydrolase